MKHARQRREKENAEAQTERCDTVRPRHRVGAGRKCDTDGARSQTDRQAGRQTDRQGRNKIGSIVTWTKSRGTTATGFAHIFLLFGAAAVSVPCF